MLKSVLCETVEFPCQHLPFCGLTRDGGHLKASVNTKPLSVPKPLAEIITVHGCSLRWDCEPVITEAARTSGLPNAELEASLRADRLHKNDL